MIWQHNTGMKHRNLKIFLEEASKVLKQEKPTLRDAKIVATLYVRKDATRQEVIDTLYQGAATTDHRALNELVQSGVIEDA